MLGRLRALAKDVYSSDVTKYKHNIISMINSYLIKDGKPIPPSHSDLNEQVYAAYEASWFSYYDLINHFWNLAEELEPILELSKHVGWWASYDDVVLFQGRPTAFALDANKVIHSATGPALEYADGAKLYAWHEMPVPSSWYTKGLTAQEALSIENAELRRAACEFLGYAKILRDLKSVVIDTDPDPEVGVLYEVDFPDEGDRVTKEKFLFVIEGHTGREFAIPVDPSLKTALEAQVWLGGFEDEKGFVFDKAVRQ